MDKQLSSNSLPDVASLSSSSADGASELAAVVDDLLNQLNSKFTTVSTELLAKMDEMSRRLDALEANIQAVEGKNPDAEDK